MLIVEGAASPPPSPSAVAAPAAPGAAAAPSTPAAPGAAPAPIAPPACAPGAGPCALANTPGEPLHPASGHQGACRLHAVVRSRTRSVSIASPISGRPQCLQRGERLGLAGSSALVGRAGEITIKSRVAHPNTTHVRFIGKGSFASGSAFLIQLSVASCPLRRTHQGATGRNPGLQGNSRWLD
jgi:hypothetical protein